MPQFNPSSFTSQLFWLAICFGLVYLSMSKIFLPRIRDTLKNRSKNINDNTSFASKIQNQIDEINITSKDLRETSASQYKLAIDQSNKEANFHKEQELLKLRSKNTKMIENSKTEINKFIQNSQNDCQQIINTIVDTIDNKFFNNKIN